MVQLPVYLPEGDYKALRYAVIDEGRAATDIIRELVKDYLVKRSKKGRGKAK